jgi:hypothetical protein
VTAWLLPLGCFNPRPRASGRSRSCIPIWRRSIAIALKRWRCCFRDPDQGRAAFELLRGLTDEVRILPEEGEYRLELKGELAGVLALAQGAKLLRIQAEAARSHAGVDCNTIGGKRSEGAAAQRAPANRLLLAMLEAAPPTLSAHL